MTRATHRSGLFGITVALIVPVGRSFVLVVCAALGAEFDSSTPLGDGLEVRLKLMEPATRSA